MFLVLAVSPSVSHADVINNLLGGTSDKIENTLPEKVITTENTQLSDLKIQKCLSEIFAELETLNKLKIDVNKGVVTLGGNVTSSNIVSKAIRLAKQVEGVVEVENEIVITRSVEKRLESTWNKILKLGNQIITSLPLFILALIVFSLAWFIGGWISNKQGFFRHLTKNPFIANLLGQITHLMFIVIGLVLALSLLDATALIGTIIGAAGILGLAIGFAVRDTVENYIASILLSLRNPFQVNEYVDIDGHSGNVARLTSRATILISADGNHIRIPNSQVFKAVIINYTRFSERRFSFDLGVDAAQNLSDAQQVAIETLNLVEGVLNDPSPLALIQELGEFNVIIRVFGWVDQDRYSFAKVRSEAIKRSKQAFDDMGIVMPEPIYQIRISDDNLASATSAIMNKPQTSTKNKAVKTTTSTNQEFSDVKPDETAKEHIQEETAADNENLLSQQAPNE
jgi:small-conductance mechanosensitive channel